MLTALPPEVVNPAGRFPCVITVDHAGATVPPELRGLGLDPAWLGTHHALDLGARELAIAVAARLDAPAVLCPTSRLVIDGNRWLRDPRSILPAIEGRAVPGNLGLTAADRAAREDAVFWPYHEALGRALARARRLHGRPILLALHSFTRTLGGVRRPWDAGTIWNEGEALSAALLAEIGRGEVLRLGSNAPYSGRQGVYTVDRHTFGTGVLGCGLEVANDQLATPKDRSVWAERVCRALEALAAAGVAA